jgi:hypothetical protein
MSNLTRLANWYYSQCDGDWEHSYGIRIATLDNPGWHLRINLDGTELYDKPLTPVEVTRSETDWMYICTRDGHFDANGGPLNLEEMVEFFLQWAAS